MMVATSMMGATLGPHAMPITIDTTPNPNAMKFSVGTPVGGPETFTDANADGNPLASSLLGIDGVVSMFMTADFVTLTKTPEAQWAQINPLATPYSRLISNNSHSGGAAR